LKLYNSLSRDLEEFIPINNYEVKLYTCGPTVYDYAHIGNLRAFVFNDTLRRALETAGYKTKHVMNITDVGHLVSDDDEGEDKLEKAADREQKTVWEVAEFFFDEFLKDTRLLNILEPNGYSGPRGKYARATDFIPQQLELVKILLSKDLAYITEQAIYFDTSKLNDYGKLTGQNLSDKEVAARSEVFTDDNKHNPQDFALWFFMVGRFANHTMNWPSDWGVGFPGWHLECSAIVHATLGEPIDIHTGGVDHIGTHHTNEIAQSEAAYDTKLANYWMHNEHLLVDSKKMSKASGNYYKLSDLVNKGFDSQALRLLFLQSHYRSQMNFTWDALNGAQGFLKRLEAWADLKHQTNQHTNNGLAKSYAAAIKNMKSSIQSDLNTAKALSYVSELALESEHKGVDVSNVQKTLEAIDAILGTELSEREDIHRSAKDLIAKRETTRQAGDWSGSDKLRQELQAQGLNIKDTSAGPVWFRT